MWRLGAVLGAGPIVRVGDRLWVFDPDISGGLAALADELASQQPSFRYQRKLMDSGACEATPLMQAGYRTGAVALPLGNYHNSGPGERLAPEYIDLDDANGLVRLLVHVAQRGMAPGWRIRPPRSTPCSPAVWRNTATTCSPLRHLPTDLRR